MRPKLKPGQWSLRHRACVICHRTAQPHIAKGKCKTCYSKKYRKLYMAKRKVQEKYLVIPKNQE